jgi:uncharacterized protein (TIGR00725 family)
LIFKMGRKTLIGVIGPRIEKEYSSKDIENAKRIGELVAENNWILLSGGMNGGVMEAVNVGARSKKGLTLGILPNDDKSTHSKDVDIPIITNMRSGRNYMLVLSCDVVIACGMGAGTASEVSLALQAQKNIILLNDDEESKTFFKKIGGEQIHIVDNPEDAITLTKEILSND